MINRRDFFKTIIRNTSILGVTAVSGYLLLRPKKEEKCDFDFVCNGCTKYRSCNLPQKI